MTITVLISGRGSNMVALHEASQRGELQGKISHVISNNADAEGLSYAKQQGIDTSVLDHSSFADRKDFDRALASLIDSRQPSLVLLAGFMRRLGGDFTRHFEGRMLNIHPSLLPRHPGLNTHARALQSADRWHGCSVHFVTAVLDGGPIIARSVVPVLSDDTPESLAKRVLAKEHNLYWRAAQLALEGRIKWRDGHVVFCSNELTYPLTLS